MKKLDQLAAALLADVRLGKTTVAPRIEQLKQAQQIMQALDRLIEHDIELLNDLQARLVEQKLEHVP